MKSWRNFLVKRIEATNLIVDGKRFHCQDIKDVVEIGGKPEMVEVTIKCTVRKDTYEKLMEDVGHERK